MKPSHQTMIRFYEHLGRVFYCIAAVDKIVQKVEIERLKEIVKNEWLPLENTFNEFGDDTAYQIEIVFKSFRNEHKSLFTKEVNDLILKTANAIATSFSAKNKSEHVLVSQLEMLLLDYN
jgi:hypothetical protein